jgi:hypothetical protein
MDINAATLSQSISHILHRYHVIIFVVVVLGALGAGVYINYQKLLAADDTNGYVAPASNTTFDDVTREQLSQLRSADYYIANPDEPRQLSVSGRINPFVEN